MARTLVVGASGQLGQALLEALARQTDDEVLGTATQARGGHLALDLRDPHAVTAFLARWQPDRVVNCAYVAGGPELGPVTADGAGVLARAFRGSRLVHLSTDLLFPGDTAEPLDEEAAPRPLNAYGHSKLEAERQVLEARPDALIVRTSVLYGGPAHAQEHAVRANRFPFYTDEVRCPTHTDDLATAIVEWAAREHCGPLHLAGADAIDRAHLARLLAPLVGQDPAAIQGVPQPAGTDRPRHLRLVSRFASALPGCVQKLS